MFIDIMNYAQNSHKFLKFSSKSSIAGGFAVYLYALKYNKTNLQYMKTKDIDFIFTIKKLSEIDNIISEFKSILLDFCNNFNYNFSDFKIKHFKFRNPFNGHFKLKGIKDFHRFKFLLYAHLRSKYKINVSHCSLLT